MLLGSFFAISDLPGGALDLHFPSLANSLPDPRIERFESSVTPGG